MTNWQANYLEEGRTALSMFDLVEVAAQPGPVPGGGPRGEEAVVQKQQPASRGGGDTEAAAGGTAGGSGRRRERCGRRWSTAGARRWPMAGARRQQPKHQGPLRGYDAAISFFLISDAAISAVDKRIRHTREERKSYDSQADLLFWALCHGPLL